MIYNILTVIFSLPTLIGDLSQVLYFSFYTLWTDIGRPKKSLPEKNRKEQSQENIKINTDFTNILLDHA